MGPSVQRIPWHGYSTFEEFAILDYDLSALGCLLSFCDPTTIIRLQRTCTTLHKAVKLYSEKTWDIEKFLSSHFKSVRKLLKFLSRTDALIYGPEVYRFFDRASYATSTLDICVRYEGVSELIKFISSQGYTFTGIGGIKHRLWIEALSIETRKFSAEKIRSSGERNSKQRDRDSIALQFSNDGFDEVKLNVHVIRCSPYSHILSLYGSLMHVISASGSLSLFPSLSFGVRKSLVCRQDYVKSDDDADGTKARLQQYCRNHGIKEIGMCRSKIHKVDIGSRYIGDPYCWYIPHEKTHHDLISNTRLTGMSFEVLDWTSFTVHPESYLRIGEPGIWSNCEIAHKQARIETNK